jgi:predicted Zn finger-like uncharacterized protein
MALATKCPHCNTIFRVAADQLKLRGGIVRCGACHEVFDGNAALVEPAAKPTPVIPEVALEAKPAAALPDFAAAAPTAASATSATTAPAIPDYVQGAPVDFELDFADGTEQPQAAEPTQAEPSSAPAVWRSAGLAPAAEDADATAGEPAPDMASPPMAADGELEAATPPAADTEAATPSAADQRHPDSRIEPSLDTPQEHVVAAALDDAHHFEDLPSEDHAFAAEALPPADEPWSLAEPERDDTALHAVAAVNTDAPDDGASLADDELLAKDATVSRRERALKRAKARRDASGPAPREPDADIDSNIDANANAAAEGEPDGMAEASEADTEAGAEDPAWPAPTKLPTKLPTKPPTKPPTKTSTIPT